MYIFYTFVRLLLEFDMVRRRVDDRLEDGAERGRFAFSILR